MTTHYIALAQEAGEANDEALETVNAKMASTLSNEGLVHLFGSGHSVLPCQEAFPRYGSYVGFNPLMDPRLMWHDVLGTGGVRELLWCAGMNRHGGEDGRALHRRASDPRWPRVMRRRP